MKALPRMSRSGISSERHRNYKLAKESCMKRKIRFLIFEQSVPSDFVSSRNFSSRNQSRFSPFLCFFSGAFRLYDVDNDGFITRDEMYNIVDAIYQMVVSASLSNYFLTSERKLSTWNVFLFASQFCWVLMHLALSILPIYSAIFSK